MSLDLSAYRKGILGALFLPIGLCGFLYAQNTELKEERFALVQKQIYDFENQLKSYQILENQLKLEEKVFERFHASIIKLKNNPSFVSNVKLSNQYQGFEEQSKALQQLRNQKSLAFKKVQTSREKLLVRIEDEVVKLRSEKSLSQRDYASHLKSITRVYDQYAELKLKSTPLAQPVNIPSELDNEKIVALKDILASLDKKIVEANRSLKHIRRKQFVQSSMMDTLLEESFFSEGQFIHAGDQKSTLAETELNTLKVAPGASGEGNTNPDVNQSEISTQADIDLGQVEPQRSIDSIEAKRNAKDTLNLNGQTFDQSTQGLEKEIIFLQAERLKIIHELQKQ